MTQPGGATPILDLRIDASEGTRAARFDLSWQGQTAGTVRAELADLGIAPATARYSPTAQPRDLARGPRPGVAGVLASLVEGAALPPGLPLALRFGRPSGALPLLPWERWLTAALGRPLLRWPYLPLRPAAPPDGPVEIAICGSVPMAKEVFQLPDLVRTAVGELRDSHPWFHFHVFADAELEGELRSRLGLEIQRDEVRIAPAASAEPFGVARRRTGLSDDEEEGTAIESPWLRWLLAKAPPRLDLVLFLCHGYLGNGRGYLAMAESPLSNRDPQWSRFVGRRQLVTFLDACGARALALCSPPGNWSVSGLLGLADEVARERPGPALVHDFEADPAGLALGRAVALLVHAAGSGPPPLAAMPEIALYAPADLLDSEPDAERRPLSTRLAQALRVEATASAGEATQQLYDRIARRTAPPERPTRDAEPERGRDRDREGAGEGAADITRGSFGLGTGPAPAGPAAPDTTATTAAPERRQEAAGQRVLERYAAGIAAQEEPDSERGQAVQEGRARALSYVVELLKKSEGGT